MSHLIEVAFRGNRKEFFRWTQETAPPLKAGVIVEADRGEDFGRVHSTGELAEVRCNGCAHGCGSAPPPLAALRLASRDEELRDKELDAQNESSRRTAMERVKANGLVMKLTDAEWQWDRRKLTIYFTSERRVDFRGLVRDLAALFRARIELKQIGVRDEAKRLSGIGRCGREYCSASWLPDLRPVNLGVAKDQQLSLNPQQISGACGRLMCCLRYEHEFYVQSRRRFPKEGKILRTTLGEEQVLACDIFNERVTLRTAEGDTRVVALAVLKEEIGSFGDAIVAERHEPIGELADDRDEMALDAVLHIGTITVVAPVVIETIAGSVVEFVVFPAIPSAAVVDEPTLALAPATATASAPAPASASATAADVSSQAPTDAGQSEPRRKRRRGRRGGRRLRAAEQRHSGESAAEPDGATDDADGDDIAGDEPLTSNNA